jgi:hypothetical protein
MHNNSLTMNGDGDPATATVDWNGVATTIRGVFEAKKLPQDQRLGLGL